MYEVKIQEFEGPFDLLLGLIEKKKLSINEISLAEITDKYLEYLKQLEKFPLEEVAMFVVVASTLMLIKSRSLMPGMQITEEEEKSIGELEDRLKIYQKIRELATVLSREIEGGKMFFREGFKGIEAGFIEPKGVDVQVLSRILSEILENLPAKAASLPEAEVKKIISLEDKIGELAERMKNQLEVSFMEFATSREDMKDSRRVELIVSFLAMLELVKQGIVLVNQGGLFGTISIKKYEQLG